MNDRGNLLGSKIIYGGELAQGMACKGEEGEIQGWFMENHPKWWNVGMQLG